MLKTSVRERNRRVQRGLQFKQRRLNLQLSRNNVLVKLQNTCVTQKHGSQIVLTVNSIGNFEAGKGAYPVLEGQLDRLYTQLEAQQPANKVEEAIWSVIELERNGLSLEDIRKAADILIASRK